MTVTPALQASWHDNLIYAIQLQAAEPEQELWRSNLVLDIDHIVEWICGADGGVRFLVAPATLVFHDVTDFKLAVDFGSSGHRMTINELSIAQIERKPAKRQAGHGAPPYCAWRIELNSPQGGEISFGASGYTQTLRAPPQELDQPRLSSVDRPPITLP